MRPNSRVGTQSDNSRLSTVSKGNRLGTTRATTSGGRNLRLATASLNSLNSSTNLDINDIKVKNIIKNKSLAKVFKKRIISQ